MGTNNDKLTEMHDRLAKAVESLVSGEDWKKMLELSRRFHTYSANNVFLILAQRPEATRVAGYRTWSSLGRHVMRGERGIAILAPCVYRARPLDENDEHDHPELAKVLRGFRVVHVFDVAQTDGEPIPDVAPVLLQDDAPASLWQLLADQVTSQGYQLSRGDCRPANGTTNYATRTVVVRDDLAGAQATKTLAHELAHVLLHGGSDHGDARSIVETEAESVAYLVCSSAGVVTDDYSFPYIARWSNGDLELIRKTAERAIGCARRILQETGLACAKASSEATV
jgi:N-terminal domain of anti-restriction factor ArdC/IrrE N-terminal-like domain